MTDPLLRRSNWWRGRSPGYFKMRSSDPDPELHYFGGYDPRDQATIWYDALRIWGIDANQEVFFDPNRCSYFSHTRNTGTIINTIFGLDICSR
jgi:hypothetical protein